MCFRVRIHQDALEGPGISPHRRFHLHTFSYQGRVGPMGPIALGVPARLFHRARASRLWHSFSREAVRIKGPPR